MSDTKQAAHAGPGDARISEKRHVAGPPGEDAIDAIDHRGRRRYYLAPQPCRRTDAPRSTSAWWVAVVWLITIVLIAFPFPWWW
jgi:hypothetical protein